MKTVDGNGPHRNHGRFRRAIRLATPIAILLCTLPAHASFSLGAFETYGLLVNSGGSGGDINTAPVNANIGIGTITGSINLHNEVVNGKVDASQLASANPISGANITGVQPCYLGGACPGGSPASVNYGISAVQQAITDALNLSQTLGAETGTPETFGGDVTLNASSGILDGSGNYVFQADYLSIGNHHTLTIDGTASDYVVINLTGNGNGNKLDGAIALTGGITPDHVLINFIGSGGKVQGAANGATLEGTFLMPNMGVQLNSLTISGHLFGGAAGQNFQFVSNAYIEQAPEPATIALIGLGLAGLGFMRKRTARAV